MLRYGPSNGVSRQALSVGRKLLLRRVVGEPALSASNSSLTSDRVGLPGKQTAVGHCRLLRISEVRLGSGPWAACHTQEAAGSRQPAAHKQQHGKNRGITGLAATSSGSCICCGSLALGGGLTSDRSEDCSESLLDSGGVRVELAGVLTVKSVSALDCLAGGQRVACSLSGGF